MKKILKRLATGFLAFATIVTALPATAVHASEKQYWTESAERVGIVEKVMNDGSIGSTFNEGHMTVEGEDAFCVDINTNFRNGYKTRADASTRMSYDQISDVALSIEYVNQYVQSHSGLSSQHIYLLKQCVVWQRLSVHLGWQCDNVRASYDDYSTDYDLYKVMGYDVKIKNELLSEALQELSEEERFILLLYGLGFNDGEIADLLKIVRRTVNYKRQRGFEKVRKRMEEKQHEEE